MNTKINLIKNEKQEINYTFIKQAALLHIIAVGMLFVVSFLSVLLFILITLSPLPSLRQREKNESKQLSYFSDSMAKVLLTDDRLTEIKTLLSKRSTYSKIVNPVKSLLPGNTLLEEIRLDNKKAYLTITSPTLEPLNTTVDQLSKLNSSSRQFKQITISSLYHDFEKNKYYLILELI